MKNMKKVLSVMLVLVMALATLAGCGGSDNSDGSAASAEKTSGDKYIIATDLVFAPFEFTDENNKFVGIDVDLLAAIAEDQGFEYELQSLGFDAAMTAVESGQADGVIAGASITEKRLKTYDFSDPYYDSTVAVGVAEGSTAASLDDLKGSTVAVKTGTQSAEWAEEIKDEYNLSLTYYKDSAMMYQNVISGNVTACFEDYPVLAYNVAQGNGLKVLYEEKTKATPYGFAVKKGENAELLEKFNAGLKNIKENGKYDEIVAKYTAAK